MIISRSIYVAANVILFRGSVIFQYIYIHIHIIYMYMCVYIYIYTYMCLVTQSCLTL